MRLLHLFMPAADAAIVRWFNAVYVRPYRVTLALVAGAGLLSAIATTGLVWLIQPAFDDAFLARDPEMLIILPLAIIGLTMINALGMYGQARLGDRATFGIQARIQSDLYESTIRGDIARTDQSHSGDIMTIFSSQVLTLVIALSNLFATLGRDLVMTAAMIAVMILRDWQLAAIATLLLPFFGLGVRRLTKRLRSRAEATMESTMRLNRLLVDVFASVRLVKLQGGEAAEVARIERATAERGRTIIKTTRLAGLATPINEVVGGLVIALVLSYAIWRAQSGGGSLGTLTSFLAALITVQRPVKRLSFAFSQLQPAVVAARMIHNALNEQPRIVDAPDARPLVLSEGTVTFDDVAFAYAGGRIALEGLSFVARRGEMIALVGPSGAGKSTVIQLLPRLYEADRGRILIDGQDIRAVTLASLRDCFAVVTQDPFLFTGTIADNIAYGAPGATRDAIEAAAKAAAIADFIATLPNGYDTEVGEGGVLLSGGQRQRIAIARAWLKNAPILLLDEATSALDLESERAVRQAIASLRHDRTTIMVAHRLVSVIDADKIFVMDSGRVVESGSHDDLIQRGGRYAALYEMQTHAREA